MYQIQLVSLDRTVRLPRLLSFAAACATATSPSVPRGVTVQVVDQLGRVVL